MVWNHSVTTKPRACVPHTPYTLILRFASPAGRVCGVATHAVGRDAGYGLLLSIKRGRLKIIFQTAFDIEFCWYMTQAAFAVDYITAWFGIIW